MADVLTGGSFANDGDGYSDLTQIVAAASNSQIAVLIDRLLALVPDNSTAQAPEHTDFIDINPQAAALLRNEITLLKAAIAAAPTS